MQLPPLPTLEVRHLRVESAFDGGQEELQALVPAAEPYVCRDERAPALLLVPGLGLDGLCFLRQLPLGALARLYFFQMPNAPAAGESGLGQFARRVEDYIAAKGLDRHPGGLVLGGASMGGSVSLHTAIRGRVKLRGLILLGTFGSRLRLSWLQRACAPLAYVAPMGFIRYCVWRFAGKTGAHSVSAQDAAWMTTMLIRRTHGYFGRAIGALTGQEQIAAARKLELPALVVHGKRDNVLPFAAGAELHQALPRSKLVPIEDARHSLFFTHAGAVNAAIAEFLRGLPFTP